MGKGGSKNQKSTVYQSQLPEYARPYFESAMTRAQEESTRPYQAYQGPRNAGMGASTEQGLKMAQAYANSGMGDLDAARDLSGQVAGYAMDLQNYDPNEISNTYTGPADWQNTQFSTDQVGFGGDIEKLAAEKFGTAQRDEYMSPFMESVTEAAQKDAQKKALEEQAYLKLGAAKANAFGGSRAAVQNQMALGQAQQRISDIGVQGRQAAFENAQQQFERDRAAAMAAAGGNQKAAIEMALSNQGQNLEAQKLAEQSKQFGYGTQEESKQRAAELGMQAQQLTEGFRQSGKELGLKGLTLASGQAQQLADFQKQMEEMQLQRIKTQLGIGQTQEDYLQREYDIGYEDFTNQRDAPRQNLQWLMSIMQGVPVSASQTVTQTSPSNPLAAGIGSFYGAKAMQGLSQ